MKGINREVVPYEVDGLLSGADKKARILSEHLAGLDLHLDLGQLPPAERRGCARRLSEAMAALNAASGERAAVVG